MDEQRKEKIHDYEPLFGAWKVAYRDGRYVCLGRGGFGAVYEVFRESLGMSQRRAVKLIENTDESNIDRIKKEIQFMFSLRNEKNIVSIEDFMEVKRKHYSGFDVLILMELLTSLETIIKRGKPGAAEVVKLGIHLSRALELCERHGVIHRDIKPANVFVSRSGVYKLGDFGIARELDEVTMTTIGTKDYMAPEIIFGRRYDNRADIYSLGLTMYFILNGNKMPFEGISGGDLPITRRLDGNPLPALRNVREELSGIVLKACAYRADDRYGSARELRGALERLSKSNGPGIAATNGRGVLKPPDSLKTADKRNSDKPLNENHDSGTNDPGGRSGSRNEAVKPPRKGAVAALCFIAAAVVIGFLFLVKPFDGFFTAWGNGSSNTRENRRADIESSDTLPSDIVYENSQYESSGITGAWRLADTVNLDPDYASNESTEMKFFPDGSGKLFHEGMNITQDFIWWLEDGQIFFDQQGYISAWDYELSGDKIKFYYDKDTDSYSLYTR